MPALTAQWRWPELETRTWAALTVCALGGAYLVWTFLIGHRVPMEVHGKRYLDAFLSCDGSTLYRYTHSEEIEANGYTPEKMAEVCRALVTPVVQQFRSSRRYDISVDDLPSVIANIQATNADGKVLEWGVQLFTTPEGPKGEFLRPAFYASTLAMAAREGAHPLDRRIIARASNELLSEHLTALQRLGIKKFPTMDIATANLKTTELEYNAKRDAAIVASGLHGVTEDSWGPWSDPSYWAPGR